MQRPLRVLEARIRDDLLEATDLDAAAVESSLALLESSGGRAGRPYRQPHDVVTYPTIRRAQNAASNLLARFSRPSTVACMATNTAPASMLEIPKHFGRRPDAVFLPADTPTGRALSEAARIQHAAAVAVLDELARRGLSLVWLAGELGENADHLRRKLYGQVPAHLRDLCAWGAQLGVATVAPAPAGVRGGL